MAFCYLPVVSRWLARVILPGLILDRSAPLQKKINASRRVFRGDFINIPFDYFSFRKHLSILRTPLFITNASDRTNKPPAMPHKPSEL